MSNFNLEYILGKSSTEIKAYIATLSFEEKMRNSEYIGSELQYAERREALRVAGYKPMTEKEFDDWCERG